MLFRHSWAPGTYIAHIHADKHSHTFKKVSFPGTYCYFIDYSVYTFSDSFDG